MAAYPAAPHPALPAAPPLLRPPCAKRHSPARQRRAARDPRRRPPPHGKVLPAAAIPQRRCVAHGAPVAAVPGVERAPALHLCCQAGAEPSPQCDAPPPCPALQAAPAAPPALLPGADALPARHPAHRVRRAWWAGRAGALAGMRLHSCRLHGTRATPVLDAPRDDPG